MTPQPLARPAFIPTWFMSIVFAALATTAAACGAIDEGEIVVGDVPADDSVMYANFRRCYVGGTAHWYSYDSNQCYTQNEGGEWTSDTGTETEKECCDPAQSIASDRGHSTE